MYKFLTIPLVLLLSGCVTYYYPETAIEDGVYYAEDDPAYINNAFVSYYGYAGAAYYPWRSLDYFYFGYGYGYGYGYPYRYYANLSGYTPYPFGYYPYYRNFSPWRRRHGDYCQPYNFCGRNNYGNGDDNGYGNSGGDDRYVGNGRGYQQYGGGADEDGNEDPGGRRQRNSSGSYAATPARRYVSTAPSGYSGDQGMVIRNGGAAKTGKSRTHPIKANPVNANPIIVSGVTPATSRPDYRSRQGGGEIRYRPGAKQGLAHTSPVVSPLRYSGGTSNPGSPPTVVIPSQGGGNFQALKGNTTPRVAGRSRSGKSSSTSARSSNRTTVSSSRRSHSTSSRSSGSGGRRSGHSRAGISQKHK